MLLFDKPPDMRFGSVMAKSDASRLLTLTNYLGVNCSFVC